MSSNLSQLPKLPALVVFDVDGTLITYDGACDPATRRVLQELRLVGCQTAIATGRPLASVPETIELIGQVDFAVCGNGGLVVDLATDEVLRRSEVPGDLVDAVAPAVRAALPGVGLTFDLGDRTIEEDGFDRRLPPRAPVTPVADALAALGSPIPDVARMTFFHDDYDNDVAGLAAIVEPFLDERVMLHHGLLLPLVEIVPAGDNKAVALDALTMHLGLTANDVLAFGDGTNDLEMLDWAGTGVAMANAADVTKAVADIVTVDVRDGGVAVLLDPLLQAAVGRPSS